MVRIFKSSDSIEIQKKGYSAKYVADVDFRKKLDSGGFILITIPAGAKTEPHTHRDLEEVFIILSDLKMKVDLVEYELEKGDVVLVNPNETHSFIAVLDSPANIIAIKFPNLKNDRVSLDTQ